MKKTSLSIAVALAIFASATIASPNPTEPGVTPSESGVTHLAGARFARLSKLADAIVATNGDPLRWVAPADTNDAPDADDPLVAWISAATLASVEARSAAVDLIRRGVDVLVTGESGEARYDAKTFGIEVPGTAVLYQPHPDGTLEVHSSANAVGRDVAAWRAVVHNAEQKLKEKTTLATTSSDTRNPPAGPFRRYRTWQVSPYTQASSYNQGSSVGMDITVVRDTEANTDRKVVIVKAHANAVPFRNGLTQNGWPVNGGELDFTDPGAQRILYIPESYELTTLLKPAEDTAANLIPIDQYPRSTSQTSMSFNETKEKTTSFSWGISGEMGADISAKGIEPSGKVKASFGGGTKSTTTTSIAMNIKDYSTTLGLTQDGTKRSAKWRFDLAPNIRNNVNYFQYADHKEFNVLKKATPMMRGADIQTYSEWSLSGDYEGQLEIASNVRIRNAVYVAKDKEVKVIVDKPTPEAGPPPFDPDFDYTTQPVSRITIDLGAPELSRYAVVLIQSRSTENACLTQTSRLDVMLAPCDARSANLNQQWEFDEYSRYVNRSTRMCLGSLGGKASMQTCSTALNQKWEWQADRIHMLNDMKSRLYVDNLNVHAGFKDGLHKLWPVNEKPLLPPWNNYPLASFPGDFIPGFVFPTPVKPEYPGFGSVGANERWMTIPMVYGYY